MEIMRKFGYFILGIIIGLLLMVDFGAHKKTADLCAASKAKVEMLNLCGNTNGCAYGIPELRDAIKTVASCELAKVEE